MELQELANAVARRARLEIPSYREEPEDALAQALERLLEAILDAVSARSFAALEQRLDELLAARAQREADPADVLRILEEVELALGEIVRAEDGASALGSRRWRAIQVALHHVRLCAVTQTCASLEGRRDATERRFEAVLETLPQFILLADAEQRVHYVNARSRDILGLEPREVVGKRFDELMAPEVLGRFADPDAFLNGARRMHARPDQPHEDYVRLRDGRILLRRSLPLEDNGGVGRVAIFSDITHLDFRAVFDTASLPELLLDSERRLVDANPGACSLLGAAKERLLGTRLDELVEVEDATAFSLRWQAFLERGEREGELRFRRPDGTVREVVFSASANALPDRHLLIVQDISEHKRTEAQFRQAQKMEAVGQLAGGVAHDFNNLLTVIAGYGEILLHRLGPEGEGARELAEIAGATERAARLTNQLLAFSRRQVLEPRVINLNEVVLEAQAMLRRLIDEDIELTTVLADDLASVSADVGQIEQVIVNLAVNARDAMPTGGRLTIETANVELDQAFARARPGSKPGSYVLLALGDTGSGMDAETKTRIFEPFFTTKEQGKGTGLGLSTVYGVVKQTGGYIGVESEPGAGTTFSIYLPQVAEEAEELEPSAPSERPLAGAETVLLVEDDEALRGLAREILERYGYTVIAAADGLQALELAESYRGAVDLLMSDVVMPNMGGIELAERLTAAHPKLKVLYTSGYSERAASAQGISPGRAFLQKPYRMETLARKLRTLLDRPGRA